MILRSSANRYAAVTIALHWLMLVLLVAVVASIELREAWPKGSDTREALKAAHFMLGLSVLLVVVLRLGMRLLAGPAPAILPTPGAWEHRLATAMHVALYALLIAMPVIGWLLLSAEGKPIPFFGLQALPLLGESEAAAEWLEEAHEAGATIGYVLVTLHAAAAFFHHYWRRDNTLRRMLPGGA